MAQSRENTLKIFLSAGEASGDLHGSYLLQSLRARAPKTRAVCIGGPLLEKAGAEILVRNGDLAVVGLFEVLGHLKAIYHAFRKIRSFLLSERPDLLILIDFPDFNFLLGRLARRHGLRVFYYISPQVWAWRSGRVRTMKRFVDKMAVILPFEPSFYSQYRMEVEYVGHPLLDVLEQSPSPKEARGRYRTADSGFYVGLLPGSRRSEIKLLLNLLLETAGLISQAVPDVHFFLPVAPTLDRGWIEEQVATLGLPVRIISGDTYGVIQACDLLITASGTVTLEAAILGTPMIITNRVSKLTYYAGRKLIRVPYIGLPNLIAGRNIIPEFVQDQAKAELIAARAIAFLKDPESLDHQTRALQGIRGQLGEPGVADRVADLIVEMTGVGRNS